MQALSRRVTRLSVAAAGAASIVLTIGGIGMAAGGGSADGSPNGSLAATPPPAAVAAAMAPGSELQFIAVAPCRIIDTRVKGGALVNAKRTFAAVAPYTAQGGNAAGCDIPTGIAAVQINLGALSYSGGVGWVKGWATGTTEPLASLVNYDKTGPVANMVTLPVNASGHFDLRTKARAHLYVDIAGYYVKPLYAAVNSLGSDLRRASPPAWSRTADLDGGVHGDLRPQRPRCARDDERHHLLQQPRRLGGRDVRRHHLRPRR